MDNEENGVDYLRAPALSKSQIKKWDNRNPGAFWRDCSFNPKAKFDKFTDAIVTGQLRHMMLFQRDLVLSNFEVNDELGKSRINKKWILAQESSKKMFITSEELKESTLGTEALLKHEVIRDLLKFAKTESPYFWHDKEWEIDCKMRTDAETGTVDNGSICIDLKTTGKDFPKYIDKEGYQYEIGFYSRGLREKYKRPMKQFIHILQSTAENDEDNIRVRVTEGPMLEACEIEVSRVVKEIAPKIREWQKSKDNRIWLPEIVAEQFEVSPWYDREISEKIKGE